MDASQGPFSAATLPFPFPAEFECSSPICYKNSFVTPPTRCDRCQKVAYCSRKCELVSWPAHKAVCRLRNYIIKFEAAPDEVDNPPVNRILSCPARATLYELHKAVQRAFDWTSPSAFYFALLDVWNPDYVRVSQEESEDLVQQMSALSVGSLNLDPYYEFPPPEVTRKWAAGIPRLEAAADALIKLPFQEQPEEFVARMAEISSKFDATGKKARQPLKILGLIKPDECKLYQLFDNPRYQGMWRP